MHNRAQFSMPFTSLFAIIVGAFLLIFFIGFAYKYISFSGALTGAGTVQALEDEFAAFAISDAAEKTLDFRQDFDFTYLTGRIYSGGQSQDVEDILFAPAGIQGDTIYLATRSVELPFRVTNAFYLADGRTMYIFVSDAPTKSAVDDIVSSYTAFPQSFPHAAYTAEQISSNIDLLTTATAGYDSVRFVFFADPSEDLLSAIEDAFPTSDVLYVSSTVDDFSSGDITFSDGTSVLYLSYPLLLGAIVSADADAYEGELDAVFVRLASVTGVYVDKAKFLAARLPSCDYGPIKGYMSSYMSIVSKDAPYTQFLGYEEKIDDANKDLGGVCPVVF